MVINASVILYFVANIGTLKSTSATMISKKNKD